MGYKVGMACEFDSRAVRVAEVEVRVALPCERQRLPDFRNSGVAKMLTH